MRLGVFLPTGNNGWILSEASPQYMPTFALNRSIVSRAEAMGFAYGLGMVTFRGYGGKTGHWDYTADVMTLTSALLATTSSMKLFASVGVLSLHPAMVARMAATIDDVAPGRLGINITTGWHRAEYAQMGMWPEGYFEYRYDYATEYATILRELWEKGSSDFKGRYFELDDCRLGPVPAHHVDICAAGLSPRGRQFSAQFADYNFTMAATAEEIGTVGEQLDAAAATTGRRVRMLVARTIILGDSDADARAKVARYNAGSDVEALANQRGHYATDAGGSSSAAVVERMKNLQAIEPDDASFFIGSARSVADRLNELAAVGALEGVLFDFDDFQEGLDRFGDEVIPLLDFDFTARAPDVSV